jgi:ribosomal protein L30
VAVEKIRVRLTRGLAGKMHSHRAVAHSLGLRRVDDVRIHARTAAVLGMCQKIRYLVEVRDAEETTGRK